MPACGMDKFSVEVYSVNSELGLLEEGLRLDARATIVIHHHRHEISQ